MTIIFPGTDRAWAVDQSTDIRGITATKNADLDQAGYLKLARKALTLYSVERDVDFTDIVAIAANQTTMTVITVNALFVIDITSPLLTVTKPFISNAPAYGFGSDAEYFQSLLHVSGGSTVKTYDGGLAATTVISGLNTAMPHPMTRHGGRGTLLVADGNVCRQYNSAYTRDTANELTIAPELVITRIIYRNNYAFLLTRNIAGGEAPLIVWTGQGVGNNGEYPSGADWIYSGCVYESGIAVITSAGQLRQFNGAGYSELDNFPVFYSDYPWTSSAATSNLIGNVASRGMEAYGTTLLMNINGALNQVSESVGGQYLPGMPSGLWEYTPKTGLHHKAGLSHKIINTLSPDHLASNALVFTTPHQLLTGDPIFCASVGGLSGTTVNQTYYANAIGPNAVQLSLSPAEAAAGISITVAGTPTASDKFSMDVYDSYGSPMVQSTGPIFVMKKLVANSFFASRVLFSAVVQNAAGTGISVLAGQGMARNLGYFVSPKIPSASIAEAFQSFIAKYPRFNLASESLSIKYRVTSRFGTPSHTAFTGLTVAFTAATTFTVNPATKDVSTLVVGDELEFIRGAASGYLAHITAIDKTANPALWTFTIDTTLPVSNGDLTDFIAMNWTKMASITSDDKNNAQNFAKRALDKSGTWVQFKVALAGREVALETTELISAPQRTS